MKAGEGRNRFECSPGPHSPGPIVLAMWVAVVIAVAIWTHFETPGWDVRVYVAAIHSLRAGHDPYADAMAIQQAYHDRQGDLSGDPPYSYVYSPITLPLLRAIGRAPLRLCGTVYWLVYIASVLASIWIAMQFVQEGERHFFGYLAPAAAFFPGLLLNGTVLSGNVAYLLYAAALCAALAGWRRGVWGWFYAVVLLASCVKAPLLSLVAIPVLSARGQWRKAALTIAAGIGLFVVQPLVWPSLFRNYLEAVDLQFLFNRDFGCSPAGLFSDAIFRMGVPYSPFGLLFYLFYAVPLFAVLLYLSGRYLRGDLTLNQWAPVLLAGVILLNPRIMEYDVAPITLPLALIAWRFAVRTASTTRGAALYCAVVFGATNAVASYGWYIRKLVDAPLLVAIFAAGCWSLWKRPRTSNAAVLLLETVPGTEIH